MRRYQAIFAAVVVATIFGTLVEVLSASAILGLLSFDPKAEAVVHFLGRLASAIFAIGAFLYYQKHLTRS